jgi:riboflavin kinase / FMN adenylyltransferase
MLVVRGYTHVPSAARGATLAIGNFDGVHRGHQALIATARAQAEKYASSQAGVIIFEPHPRLFFQPATPLFQLTSLEQKLDLLSSAGLSLTVILPFDATLAALSAEAFIRDVLVNGLAVRHLIAGYDFHFGKGRAGSPATLRAAAEAKHFDLTIMEPVKAGTDVASSSAARMALAEGAVDKAAAILGRWWRVSGVVTGGAKRGTGMGYPTANVTLPAGTDLAHGIYAARVYVEGVAHPGAAYLGTRPTFDNGNPVLETFLLDFDGDLYGKTIAVEFIARLRGDQAFVDMPTLIVQMDKDVAETRKRLAALALKDPYPWPTTK